MDQAEETARPNGAEAPLPGTAPARRSWRRLWPVALLGLLVLPMAGPLQRAPAEAITVLRGDTLMLDMVPVRLSAVASPPAGHGMHDAARAHLTRLLRGATAVECRLIPRVSRPEMRTGRCHALLPGGSRIDLQRAMVEAGFARTCLGLGALRVLIFENAESLSLPFAGFCSASPAQSGAPTVLPEPAEPLP